MKTMIVLFMLAASMAHAQSSYDNQELEKLVRHYRSQKNVGMVFTVGGVTALTAGLIEFNHEIPSGTNGKTKKNWSEKALILIISGVSTVAWAIPAWAVGSHKYRYYLGQIKYVSARFSVAPGSVTFSLRF